MGAESTHERLHGSGPSVGSDRAFALVFAALFGAVATPDAGVGNRAGG